ncbi:MAG: lamin tail domain-containing protein [Deltaproteobacteria bacterium]|nr:lamin tail domain-containing protein [Deltaproteobacteria bacterium]
MRTSPASLLVLLSFGLLATACEDFNPMDSQQDSLPSDTFEQPPDADGDGWTVEDGDCDDNNAAIHPTADEECNGIDDNCNDQVDEGFADTDGDGTADCVDSESCDGIDNDGDGSVDEDFADTDGDGIADCVDGEDCDGIDNNGDGRVDEGYDFDRDGYTQCGSKTTPADCNDKDATVYPGAEEILDNGKDDDCDGYIDEGVWVEGDLVICEILNNPNAVSDAYGEWFEIYNASERTVYLNGVVISSSVDDDYHVIQGSNPIALAAGEVFVLGKNDDPDLNGNLAVDYLYTDIVLSNESDDLILTADDIVLDTVTWDDGATMPDVPGSAMSLDPDNLNAVLNDNPAVWCLADTPWSTFTDFGSPGMMNDLCSSWDHDGDGLSRDDGDCDDRDIDTYPGAYETNPKEDNDCDGDIEWMPGAVPDYESAASSLLSCEPLYLVGSGSSDPEGEEIVFEWELVSAPEGSERSTADIDTPTSVDPVFYPDVAGSYTFSLVVTDPGDAASYTETLTVEIAERPWESAPVADAGEDQSSDQTSTCYLSGYDYVCDDCADVTFTLDGTGTFDDDGDLLEYLWTASSSYASIADPTAVTTTVTVSGIPATYGSTTTETILITLDVEDCPHQTGSDEMTITYTCTGV